jgi:hypothetical protein
MVNCCWSGLAVGIALVMYGRLEEADPLITSLCKDKDAILRRYVSPLFFSNFFPVFQIHRIHIFLGLPDPDPLVRGMDPDPDPSVIKQK